MSSTRTLVTLLRPWIRRFTIIISAWWLRTSSKFTWEEVKTSTGKLGKWSTPKRVRIRPKYSAPSLSRDRRIKMHQSINQSIKFRVFKNCSLNRYYQSITKLLMFLKRLSPFSLFLHLNCIRRDGDNSQVNLFSKNFSSHPWNGNVLSKYYQNVNVFEKTFSV